jgi:GDPmannose 4,6-dehydratase
MWLMLQQNEPDDYVVATGETHTVREFVATAFGLVGLDYKDYVKADADLFRPAEVNVLLGDATHAEKRLGWQPRVRFEALVREMLESDCRLLGVENRVGATPSRSIAGQPA